MKNKYLIIVSIILLFFVLIIKVREFNYSHFRSNRVLFEKNVFFLEYRAKQGLPHIKQQIIYQDYHSELITPVLNDSDTNFLMKNALHDLKIFYFKKDGNLCFNHFIVNRKYRSSNYSERFCQAISIP